MEVTAFCAVKDNNLTDAGVCDVLAAASVDSTGEARKIVMGPGSYIAGVSTIVCVCGSGYSLVGPYRSCLYHLVAMSTTLFWGDVESLSDILGPDILKVGHLSKTTLLRV